jgi:hypothetical protein
MDDDDMMDEGDHHPYKLKFMVDSICLIKIHHNQVCLIHVFDKISSMMSKILSQFIISILMVWKSKHHPCGRF